jgi:hypothetical protein
VADRPLALPPVRPGRGAAGADPPETVTVGPGARLRAWLAARLGRQTVALGPAEIELAALVRQRTLERDEALKALADRDTYVRELRSDVEIRDLQIKAREVYIAELCEVIARDRKRIEAETARFAAEIRGAVPQPYRGEP